jgi:hypothetical protein
VLFSSFAPVEANGKKSKPLQTSDVFYETPPRLLFLARDIHGVIIVERLAII